MRSASPRKGPHRTTIPASSSSSPPPTAPGPGPPAPRVETPDRGSSSSLAAPARQADHLVVDGAYQPPATTSVGQKSAQSARPEKGLGAEVDLASGEHRTATSG